MHQVPAQHPIAIKHQIVEGLLTGRGCGWSWDCLSCVEDRHNFWISAQFLSQFLGPLAHSSVAVEVDADG